MPIVAKLFVIFVLLVVLLTLALPRLMAYGVTKTMRASCADCEFSLDAMTLAVAPVRVTLHGVHWAQGDPRETQVNLIRATLEFTVGMAELLHGRVRFPEVSIFDPEVVVTEGDLTSPKDDSPPEDPTPLRQWMGHFQAVNLTGGRFTYRRNYPGKSAVLSITELRTHLMVSNSEVHTHFVGLLEKSGRFQLNVTTPIALKDSDSDVELNIQGQSLSALNPFFEPSEGIQLNGKLLDGKSRVKIRARRSNGWVKAQFEGLDVHAEKTREHGALATFFTNLLSSLTMRKENLGLPRAKQIKPVELEREPNWTALQFYFKSLAQAAIGVATAR